MPAPARLAAVHGTGRDQRPVDLQGRCVPLEVVEVVDHPGRQPVGPTRLVEQCRCGDVGEHRSPRAHRARPRPAPRRSPVRRRPRCDDRRVQAQHCRHEPPAGEPGRDELSGAADRYREARSCGRAWSAATRTTRCPRRPATDRRAAHCRRTARRARTAEVLLAEPADRQQRQPGQPQGFADAESPQQAARRQDRWERPEQRVDHGRRRCGPIAGQPHPGCRRRRRGSSASARGRPFGVRHSVAARPSGQTCATTAGARDQRQAVVVRDRDRARTGTRPQRIEGAEQVGAESRGSHLADATAPPGSAVPRTRRRPSRRRPAGWRRPARCAPAPMMTASRVREPREVVMVVSLVRRPRAGVQPPTTSTRQAFVSGVHLAVIVGALLAWSARCSCTARSPTRSHPKGRCTVRSSRSRTRPSSVWRFPPLFADDENDAERHGSHPNGFDPREPETVPKSS